MVATTRGQQPDLDRADDGIAHAGVGAGVEPVVQGEAVELVDQPAVRLVEAHQDHDRDGHERVGQHEQTEDQDDVRPHPTKGAHSSSSVPARLHVEQHHHHDDQHQDHRERAGGRIVVGVGEQVLDDVAHHALVGAAEQLGVDVVAGGRDEGQQGPGHHAGQRQRPGDLPEADERRGVEVTARLDQAVVDLVDAGEQRKHHERQEVVGQARDHRDGRGEQPAVLAEDLQELQGVHDETVVGQDQLPRQRAHQEAGEERGDHQHQHQVLPAARLERDGVGQHVAEHQAEQGGQAGVQERPQQGLPVVLQRIDVVAELPGHLVAGEHRPIGVVQARRDEGVERDDEEQRQPDDSGDEQQVPDPPALPHLLPRLSRRRAGRRPRRPGCGRGGRRTRVARRARPCHRCGRACGARCSARRRRAPGPRASSPGTSWTHR